MTAKRQPPAEGLARLCIEKGISLTSKRKVVLKVLETAKGHPDAQAVFYMAKKIDSSIGIATVYRTLKLMEERKVLNRHTFGQEHSHFESPAKEQHDHLVCTSCGAIEEFHGKDLDKLLRGVARKKTFRMQSYTLEIYGLCAKCAAKVQSKKR